MNAEEPGSAYRAISLLFFPFWCLHALWHGYTQNLPNYWIRRLFGYGKRSNHIAIWVHGSSVGEITAITPLVKALIKHGETIFFTSFTATGLQTIQREFPDQIKSDVIPIDCLPCCQYFLSRHQFKLCLLMETELWPELLYQTARRRIPIIQINARLSDKTTAAPIFIRYLLRRTLSNISLHLTRSQLDRQRLIRFGSNPNNIKVIGNLKSAFTPLKTPSRLVERPYMLLASSHEGEEALFLQHRREINILIVIAARHPRRSRSIEKILSASGLCYAVRSRGDIIKNDTQIYLVDTLGELTALIAHAQLVVMGGSFDQTGGHNLAEPANLGCPIITGPSDHNIITDRQQLGDSIFQVESMESCWQKIEYWLEHPEIARDMAQKARAIMQQQTHVLAAYLTEIQSLL